jgi:release factor glutamine methyltransferase
MEQQVASIPEVASVIRRLAGELSPVSRELSRSEAERIVEHVLQCSRSELYGNARKQVTPEQHRRIRSIARHRLSGTPLAYALGSAYFYNGEISVTPEVLIPRPETEVLIEVVLTRERESECLFLDMGCGSGNITAALLCERRDWRAVASDISIEALGVAALNCADRVCMVCADRLSALKASNAFDFVVSNPPYVSEAEMDTLESSVADFEPRQALWGGVDGLDFYRCLAGNAARVLKPNGRLYCEIGATQDDAVRRILGHGGWSDILVHNDLANRPRVVTAQTGT